MVRSYGSFVAAVEGLVGFVGAIGRVGGKISGIMSLLAIIMLASAAHAQQPASPPLKLAVLGDSLTAGLGLPIQQAFPARLEKALREHGFAIDVLNAGVSGDTSSGGRDRLDWSIPDGTDAVIVELGANDTLRGLDPKITRAALDEIVKRLKARNMAVLLAGMYAPRNYGADYVASFDAIYPDLAKAYDVPLYPFFLDGVAADATLNQADGLHPTAAGVDIIVSRILPTVEAFLRTLVVQQR
jgi:acyl-CoA thioesterase-1